MGSSNTRRRLIGSLAASVILAGLIAAPAAAACRDDQVEVRWPGGQARFTVEVADTDASRSRGLMHRESMARSAGMLFIYESPRRATFWMKNTLIPLDMIFADPSGRVTKVHANAIPQDLTTIDGGEGVKFVLEINGGLAARLGIAEGAEMRHPSISNPAWPCAE
ncbi:DUF192 domain-containing protein [Pseudorhodobacter sp. MZDSW-24AT]|uniref:DUF192 domain-containing protein n=1 Tax=Pseudorhodobacter sp. MZDSW-24AT TaxID=2052957 RepID=UPI000C1DE607|nr:DUF192 domain-containing protein [Pseudorhodobacter sp. MZDSW-24AT]PJF11212.1 hypothetical protein CUR21_00995 [Pseudorhodobacter sp. MZDSW-24AT]